MDDLMQVFVYVAFLLIYLASKALNNKKKKPVTRMPAHEVKRQTNSGTTGWTGQEAEKRQRREGRSGMDEPDRRPGTFEEWMQELTGDNPSEEAQRREREEESRRRTYALQKQKAKEKAEEIRVQTTQKTRYYTERLSGSMRQAKKDQLILKKSEKEIERLVAPIKQTKYQTTKKRTLGQDIARSLRNAQNARQAIILSEIINRKYF